MGTITHRPSRTSPVGGTTSPRQLPPPQATTARGTRLSARVSPRPGELTGQSRPERIKTRPETRERRTQDTAMTGTPGSWSRTEGRQAEKKRAFPELFGVAGERLRRPSIRPVHRDPTGAQASARTRGRALQSAGGERSPVSETRVWGRPDPRRPLLKTLPGRRTLPRTRLNARALTVHT